MNYDLIDGVELAAKLSATTGLGDLSSLPLSAAEQAETAAASLEVRTALVVALGPDGGGAALSDQIALAVTRARAIADAIQQATGHDTSAARNAVLDQALAEVQSRHFQATWRLEHDNDLPDATSEALTTVLAQADVEAAILGGIVR